MKNIIKYIALIIIPFCTMMISCESEDNYDTSDSPNLTYIRNIRILNVADTVIPGKVNELTKEIKFPKLDSLSDLSAVRFAVDLPEGAHLDQETYDFTVAEGETQKQLTVTVVNGKRYREYLVTIRLSMPIFGADFTKAKVYDHARSGGNIYPDFDGILTRSADIDSEHVLIVSRVNGTNLHLLKLDDLKQGNINPIALDMTDVGGGAYTVSSGRFSHGHIYVCNLVTSTAAPFTIYHWDNATAVPTKVFSETAPLARVGDDLSVNLDENGNGYIYSGTNSTHNLVRIKVTGFTTLSEPVAIPMAYGTRLWNYFNLVEGSTTEYLFTKADIPIHLVSYDGTVQYSMATTAFPLGASDPRIFNYNEKRYFGFVTANLGTVNCPDNILHVYDITRGATTQEALELLEAGSKIPELKYDMKGSATASAYPANFNWAISEDSDFLYLLGASPNSGFVFIEAPKAEEYDEYYYLNDDWK
ncbi:MAG: DUF4623 domain-containing protein [Prevotellaceae bacterium]|jgi:hypothetical protein|nr:DUF4623 domain-containing protein [Prevotellaceae bacterium]